MNKAKKWLPVSLTALLIAGVLTGCPSKEDASPDQALKAAYKDLNTASYNFDGYIAAKIKEDATALIGTKGGLTEEQAAEELDFADELATEDSKRVLEAINNGKATFKGAVDSKNIKYEIIGGVDFEFNGMKMSFELPIQAQLKKGNIFLLVDPKPAKALGVLPPTIGNKLIKATPDDIPGLAKSDKEKIEAISTLVPKYISIVNSHFEKLDANMFKEISVSEEAKKAGAVRTIQFVMTPAQAEKWTKDVMADVINALETELKLPADAVAEMKKALEESNQSSQAFMSDSVTEYSLNDKGQVVYSTFSQNLKGAKHTAAISGVFTISGYDKPNFTVDAEKQGTVSIMELMAMMR